MSNKRKINVPENTAVVLINDGTGIHEFDYSIEELKNLTTNNDTECHCGGNCHCHENPMDKRIAAMRKRGCSEETIAKEPVASFIDRAMIIEPIEFENKVTFRDGIILENYSGTPTVVYEEGGYEILRNAAVIGTPNSPLGYFIPTTASIETLNWASDFFGRAADRKIAKLEN